MKTQNLPELTSELPNFCNKLSTKINRKWETLTRPSQSSKYEQQENKDFSFIQTAVLTSVSKPPSFKIKIPFFPKRPFGKHESFNGAELNFVELDCKSRCHNLYEKHSKFFKLACGRATSLGRTRDRSKSFKRQSVIRIC